MNLKDSFDVVNPFFLMKEMDILNKFADLSKNSIFIKPKKAQHEDHASVLVPGTRKDKVLLVAHADTVWHDAKILSVAFGEDHAMFYSDNREKFVNKRGDAIVDGKGIGADDRAGCAALWAMRDMGHSLLIVNGEEHGCLGSSFLMSNEEMAAKVQDHQFVVQFDRNGREDLVFYNVGTKKFAQYCENSMPGFKYVHSPYFSDIGVLCEKICGVNVSIGYKNEHTPNEILNLRVWLNTVTRAMSWLSTPSEIPQFKRFE